MEDIKDILSSASFYKQGYFYNDKMPILPEMPVLWRTWAAALCAFRGKLI